MKYLYRLVVFLYALFWACMLSAVEKKVDCHRATYPHVQCEAHVYPNEAHWTVSVNGIRADYERGILVYLTLPDEVWAEIQLKVQDKTLTFYGRWHNGKAEFR